MYLSIKGFEEHTSAAVLIIVHFDNTDQVQVTYICETLMPLLQQKWKTALTLPKDFNN